MAQGFFDYLWGVIMLLIKTSHISWYMFIFILITAIPIGGCIATSRQQTTFLPPTPPTLQDTTTAQKLDITLALFPEPSSNNLEELEKFSSVLHNILSSKLKIYRADIQNIPLSILPDETETFLRLANTDADMLLQIKLEFQESPDSVSANTSWMYAIAQVQLLDPIQNTVLWQDVMRNSRGIVHWPGSNSSRWEAIHQLAPQVAQTILQNIPKISRPSQHHIRFVVTTDSQSELKQIQAELLRLSQAKYFQMIGTPTILSCLLTATLDYSGDLLELKLLWEDVCQSLGLPSTIKIGRRLLILEINH